MSDISRFLADLVRHREEMDARGLLVALYEYYKSRQNFFLKTDEKVTQVYEYHLKIKSLRNNDTSTTTQPLLIPASYWSTLTQATDPFCFILASMEYCAVQVDQHIKSTASFLEQVKSPISSAYYLLTPRQNTPWSSDSARYIRPGCTWFKDLHIIPEMHGFQNRFFKLPRDLVTRMERAIQSTPSSNKPQTVAKIAVWPIHRKLSFSVQRAAPRPVEHSDHATYVPFYLTDNNQWQDHVTNFQTYILPRCQEEKILVLVLPELTVPPDFLDLLKKALWTHYSQEREKAPKMGLKNPECYPVLMIAGSFHVSANTDPREAVNRATVLNYRGEEIAFESDSVGSGDVVTWSIEKLTHYKINRNQLPDAVALKAALGLDDTNVAFASEPGRLGTLLPIVYAGPRFGMMTVVICIDFLEGLRPWLDLFQGKGWVDWVFVPSASTETKPFSDTNKEWSKKGVCTVVVNACWLLEQAKKWDGALFAQAGIPQGALLSSGSSPGQSKRYARWKHDHWETQPGQFSLPPSDRPNTPQGCNGSCETCLAILEMALDETTE